VSPPDPIKRDILRKPAQPRFRRIDLPHAMNAYYEVRP